MYEYYFGKGKPPRGLTRYDVEISYGGTWVSLEQEGVYEMQGESFAQTSKQYRRTTATSPVIAGDVLVHSVPDMVSETVKIWVHGQDQGDLWDNIEMAESLFDQFTYSMRVTKDDYRETMLCQQATNITIEAGQVYAHNVMGLITAQFPRYPKISRERV